MTTDRTSFAGELPAPPGQDAAARRLRGSPWEHVPLALALYRACLGVGGAIARSGVSADALTYASLAVAALAGVAAAVGWFAAAAGLILLSGALDLFDGIVARASGRSSRWGALLDSTVDRASDALPLLGLVVFYAARGPFAFIPGVALVGSFGVSYVRARAEALGTVLPPLFMRRPERVVLLTLSLAAGLLSCERTEVPAPLTLFGSAVLALSTFLGVVVALRAARTALSARDGRD